MRQVSFSFLFVGKKLRSLSDDALVIIAHRFAVLAEPMRLRLLHTLDDRELSVNALAEATGGTQANISRHLRTLADAGLVARRKEGLQAFYSIADPSIFELCRQVCGSIEEQLSRRSKAFR